SASHSDRVEIVSDPDARLPHRKDAGEDHPDPGRASEFVYLAKIRPQLVAVAAADRVFAFIEPEARAVELHAQPGPGKHVNPIAGQTVVAYVSQSAFIPPAPVRRWHPSDDPGRRNEQKTTGSPPHRRLARSDPPPQPFDSRGHGNEKHRHQK